MSPPTSCQADADADTAAQGAGTAACAVAAAAAAELKFIIHARHSLCMRAHPPPLVFYTGMTRNTPLRCTNTI